MINRENVADQRAYDLLSNLESTARRSASGAHWEDRIDNSRYNFSSAHFNTAVVVVAIARMDPASPLLRDGMRYLVTQRANGGGWASSYETAWVLMGLIESMKATSDFNPRYSYAADLNGKTLLSGGVDAGNRLTAVTSSVPLADLQGESLNELRISREDGSGNLYYRALLTLERPAEEAEAKQNGLSITRSYHGIGAACTTASCPMIESLTLGSASGVAEVRLTLTLPNEMSYLVVEDFIPAGAEIIDPRLNTSQAEVIAYDPRDPFGDGWGWWYFNDAQVYDDHVRWIGQRVPAGTYVLTYYLQAVQAGEYHTLPAHAYEYYFPDVRGNTLTGTGSYVHDRVGKGLIGTGTPVWPVPQTIYLNPDTMSLLRHVIGGGGHSLAPALRQVSADTTVGAVTYQGCLSSCGNQSDLSIPQMVGAGTLVEPLLGIPGV